MVQRNIFLMNCTYRNKRIDRETSSAHIELIYKDIQPLNTLELMAKEGK